MNDNFVDEAAYLSETLSLIDAQLSVLVKELEKDAEALSSIQTDTNKPMIYVENIYDLIDVTTREAEVAYAQSNLESSMNAADRLIKQRKSPYFGRFDIKHSGYGEYEKIYIGRFSLLDTETFRGFVYDWRAPISSIYYEEIGDVTYKTPDGEQTGNVNLKRQYKIVDSVLQYLFDAEVTVNDEMLAEALAQSSTDRLKVIVNTIQREQNTAIRHTGSDALVVFGPAGSGKTSVGMHRLAWLLYSEREKLSARNCLIVSSSSVFSSYIADVLPDLGEDNVESVVFDKLLNIDGYHEQAAYVSGATPDDSRMVGIRIKYSEAFMEYIRLFFDNFDFRFSDVIFRNDVICSASRLSELVYDGPRRFPFDIAYNRIVSFIESECDEYFSLNKNRVLRDITEESEELLLSGELSQAYKRIRRDFTLQCVSEFDENNALDDIYGLYSAILQGYCAVNNLEPPDSDMLYEDQLVMVYIASRTGKLEPRSDVTQVLLDEAQDYSPVHIALLRHLFPKSNFTILADTQQAIYQDITITSPGQLVSLFPGADTIRLQHSYRCTREIFEFACNYIGEIPSDSHARSGDAPKVIHAHAMQTIESILADKEAGAGTVGIITRTTLEARELHRKMTTSASLITTPDSSLTGGVTVLPMYYVKGLEFDTVILVNCEKPDEPLSGNIMYTLCTRALHRLFLVIDET